MTEPVFRSADPSTEPPDARPVDAAQDQIETNGTQGSTQSDSSDGGALDDGSPAIAESSAASPPDVVAPPGDDLEHAYDVLRQAVGQLKRRGRTTTSAGVKSVMMSIDGGFSETDLGFAGFRAFLEDAAGRGTISLGKAPTGPDVVITLPGQETPPTDQPGVATDRKVRPLVWRAFVAWDNDLLRVYDRDAGDIRLVEGASDHEGRTTLEKDIAEHGDRFIEIEPIPGDAQLKWMRDFAATLAEGPVKVELSDALAAEKPLADFARVIRGNPTVAGQWHRLLTQQVKAVIADWSSSHNVSLKVDSEAAVGSNRRTSPARAAAGAGTPKHRDALAEIRAEILAAIARLPTEELMQIKIPAGYLFKR